RPESPNRHHDQLRERLRPGTRLTPALQRPPSMLLPDQGRSADLGHIPATNVEFASTMVDPAGGGVPCGLQRGEREPESTYRWVSGVSGGRRRAAHGAGRGTVDLARGQ